MNTFAYIVPGGRARAADKTSQVLSEDTTLTTGRKSLEKAYGDLTTVELDLLRLSSAVFAADRASPRGAREQLTRHIELRVPVTDLDLFLPHARRLESLLRELSQDIWRLHFTALTSPSGLEDAEIGCPESKGKTLLFSGGLDSLAAAVEFSTGPEQLLLVSHRTHNTVTDRAQKDLVALLRESGRLISHVQAFVSSRDGGPTALVHDAEPSQRTRSFVFLAVGAICARRTGRREMLYMAENGQMAIHLPLTTGRIGAFSTRTAHPYVLSEAQELLSAILSYPVLISNPYLYLTKAEVVSKIWSVLPQSVALSTSCWKNARIAVTGATHCGECVPCIMRRIAVETCGKDPTAYARDAFATDFGQLPADDEARRNLYDIAEFISLFQSTDPQGLLMEFPELINPKIDPGLAISMYKRFAGEASTIFGKYPVLGSLLQ